MKMGKPRVGDGVTVVFLSDREACTVIDVNGDTIRVQRDKVTLINGPNSGEPDALRFHPSGLAAHVEGVQRYEYEANPEGPVSEFSLRKNGEYVRVGESVRDGTRLIPGRHEHYDYNF